ncbi:uncharacterized protein BP5553_05927 [Venustampulla echinocandica]|uniref:Uncharacterized protein n=1 Tax=Venustampulla echinocandica TaxID=2656787 RepID=A0A370TM26_9HELO|nr:uncharacterized protein BP5553_05927 [Venustampulla echinocandica]RDL36575.1 hypothetical protein BP5553_05927 [Venustampulla echinocandica]
MANATLWQELDASPSVSLVSLVEPRVCFNEDCLFPLGPACEECANECLSSVSDWEQKVGPQKVGSAVVDGSQRETDTVGFDDQDNRTEASVKSSNTGSSGETIIAPQKQNSYRNSAGLAASVPQNLSQPSELSTRRPIGLEASGSSIPAARNQSSSQSRGSPKAASFQNQKTPSRSRSSNRNIKEWLASVPLDLALGEVSYQSLKSSEAPRSSNLAARNLNSHYSPIHSQGPGSLNPPPRAPTHFYLSDPSLQPASAIRLDNWLTDIFNNTLEGHVNDEIFNGGANEENTTLDFCPLCYAPVGDPIDQHLLRCQYAHDEAERREESIMSTLKRNNGH